MSIRNLLNGRHLYFIDNHLYYMAAKFCVFVDENLDKLVTEASLKAI